MKIAIEAQRIFRPNKHGMDFVALETIRCLQKIDTKNEYFIFTGEGGDRCLEETPNMHIETLRCPTYPLWEQWALPRAVARVKPDLLHCTSNTAPVWGRTPLVLTLHDIIFLEKQASRNKSSYQSLGRIYRRLVVPRILPKCRKIITVSQFECDRIRTALGLDPERITAIYNGYNERFRPLDDVAQRQRADHRIGGGRGFDLHLHDRQGAAPVRNRGGHQRRHRPTVTRRGALRARNRYATADAKPGPNRAPRLFFAPRPKSGGANVPPPRPSSYRNKTCRPHARHPAPIQTDAEAGKAAKAEIYLNRSSAITTLWSLTVSEGM